MTNPTVSGSAIPRRVFLRRVFKASALASLTWPAPLLRAASRKTFEAGEGRVDISPPVGITMGGFHYSPAKPRCITGIRQPAGARALVLRLGRSQAAVISLDMLNVTREFTQRVQRRVARATDIPPAHVRVCATHSHSMPSIAFNRHWGDQHPAYFAEVEDKIVRAVQLAKADLAPSELSVGRTRATGANFNRTVPKWKTDDEFTRESTDADRWLDSSLHVLHFARTSPKRNLLWYHFSAHPVCFTDTLAGPDWPGVVERLAGVEGLPAPSFLQGHVGDVNPGHGTPWLGKADETAAAVLRAIRSAMDQAQRVPLSELRVVSREFQLPLDLALFQDQIARYRSDPSKCTGGEWVDAAFAKDWFDTFATKWNLKQSRLPTPLSVLRLGDLGLLFHSAELYSYYGLAIRRDSPLPHTLVVGYADGYVGYLPDPRAYEAKEYAAIVVPKILNFPPFKSTAARELTGAAVNLLKQASG